MEGTTRRVKCPKDLVKMITQACMNGEWVTQSADQDLISYLS
jgi:hypothetical protein